MTVIEAALSKVYFVISSNTETLCTDAFLYCV
jgi:hypothetical protein